jgi:GT2 family glycosyltransferase
MLLNNDTEVEENLVEGLLKTFDEYPKAGAISPKIYFAKGYEFHKHSLNDPSKEMYTKGELGHVIWYAGGTMDWNNVYGSNFGVDEVDNGQFEKVRETDFATGCCVMYTAKVLRNVGLLDEKYYLYLEDADVSERIKRNGHTVLYTPYAHLWHKVSQSSGIGSQLNDYFITRNRLLFGIKYAPTRAKIALLRESIRFLRKGRQWQVRGARDFYLLRFGRGSWK